MMKPLRINLPLLGVTAQFVQKGQALQEIASLCKVSMRA